MSWKCSHGCTYSDFEMEMGMSFATLEYLQRTEELEHNLAADLENEREMGRAHVLGKEECPWPWYADPPFEVEDPEVIDAAI